MQERGDFSVEYCGRASAVIVARMREGTPTEAGHRGPPSLLVENPARPLLLRRNSWVKGQMILVFENASSSQHRSVCAAEDLADLLGSVKKSDE